MEGTITGPRALTMVRVKDTIRMRLEKMVDRYEEIGRSLADPAVIGRQREFRDLSVEYARLTPVAEKYPETTFVSAEPGHVTPAVAG